jgi:hypothetical protein
MCASGKATREVTEKTGVHRERYKKEEGHWIPLVFLLCDLRLFLCVLCGVFARIDL